jgi:hypothetical protein
MIIYIRYSTKKSQLVILINVFDNEKLFLIDKVIYNIC